jgi:hypothetical protein
MDGARTHVTVLFMLLLVWLVGVPLVVAAWVAWLCRRYVLFACPVASALAVVLLAAALRIDDYPLEGVAEVIAALGCVLALVWIARRSRQDRSSSAVPEAAPWPPPLPRTR